MSRQLVNGGRIVIIGGGVIGLAIAFHLGARGYRNVTVLERDTLAAGATAKATGGIRQQFSSEINIEISRRAVDYYAHFVDHVGEPIAFRQHGYLFLLSQPEQLATFRRNAEKQQAHGVPTRILGPDEIREVMPHIVTADLIGASYCPTDGSASPSDVSHAFARQARRHGVEIRETTAVTGIWRDRAGAIGGVETAAGPLEAELVIDAAGPWAASIGQMVGIEIPVAPHRRQAFGIAPMPWITPELPLTIDFATGAYLHPERDGGVIGGTDRQTPVSDDTAVDWSMTGPLIEALVHRIPRMADAELRRGWAGLREMTPDDHGIVGPAPNVPGFWIAAGFSGHGFMHAPIIGQEVAEWLLTDAPSLNLSPLRLSRFQEPQSHGEATVF